MYPRDFKSQTLLHSSSKLLQQKFAELLWSIIAAKFHFLQHFQACSQRGVTNTPLILHTLCYGLLPLCYRNTEHKKNWALIRLAWKCSLWEQRDSDLSAETLTKNTKLLELLVLHSDYSALIHLLKLLWQDN